MTAICGAAESPLPPTQPGASLPDKADLPDVGKNQSTRYNVLFIAVDDLNDWVGCLGGHPQAITPNLDRLAKQQAMVMNKAYCPSTVCCPSRSALLTGMTPPGFKCEGVVNLLDMYPTLVELCGLPPNSQNEGYCYTWYGGRADGAEELYDHSVDPLEHTNLAANPEYNEIIARFKKLLPAHDEPDSPRNGADDGDKKAMRRGGKSNDDE